MRNWLMAVVMAVLAGCASAPVEDNFLEGAQAALQRAMAAGAQEHAPVELRFAREKLAEAQAAQAERDYALAQRLAEQCEINATLAIARTEAAQARKPVFVFGIGKRKICLAAIVQFEELGALGCRHDNHSETPGDACTRSAIRAYRIKISA